MNQPFPTELAALYRRTLLDDVVHFWMAHALDPSGAINNCIDDEGNVPSRAIAICGRKGGRCGRSPRSTTASSAGGSGSTSRGA